MIKMLKQLFCSHKTKIHVITDEKFSEYLYYAVYFKYLCENCEKVFEEGISYDPATSEL